MITSQPGQRISLSPSVRLARQFCPDFIQLPPTRDEGKTNRDFLASWRLGGCVCFLCVFAVDPP